jgi:hypothetical protein
MTYEKEGRAYSVRLSSTDLRRLKQISERLGGTESHLVRFALRYVLSRLAPLQTGTGGPALLPVFLEFGREMLNYFDLDEDALDRLLNDGTTNGRRIDREDIGLLLIHGLEEPCVHAHLTELTDVPIKPGSATVELKNYLYDKYLYRRSA